MTRRNVVLNRIRDRDCNSALTDGLMNAAKHDRIENALRDILERLISNDMFAELEVGCDGNGPIIRAYRALEEEIPPELVSYLDDEDDAPTDTTGNPVRCTTCGWLGDATELGGEGECGGEGCPGTAVIEITEPTDLIKAWQDSEGRVAGAECAAAGLIAPRQATANEVKHLDLEPGDTVWAVTETGYAALRAARQTEGEGNAGDTPATQGVGNG